MKLLGKIFLTGKIRALTGLAIGGSTTDVVIGGIDSNVIKNSAGVPYIPGSSLKGKMRSLLEKAAEKNICECGMPNCSICVIFGSGAHKRAEETGPTRLLVRDAHMNLETKRKMENSEDEFKELELTYTEGKWENKIDRITSKAEHPRQIERVPAGAEFDYQMVYNIMEKDDIDRLIEVFKAMALLEDDYLGRSGSRGYGRIKFIDFTMGVKSINDYEENNYIREIYKGGTEEFMISQKDWKGKLLEKLGLN
ncbi:MAG: type III-A CRISPR-associated RAMP protein Csm3 [Peptococcales bacterium]